MNKACYRKLHSYKYQLVDDYVLNIDIKEYTVDTEYLKMNPDGQLTIKKGYAWDGASGPAVDTHTILRGALVHDSLYQLIRMQELPYTLKEKADLVFKNICTADGMIGFRAWYVHLAVKLFGGHGCRPGSQRAEEIVCLPIG